MYFGEQKFERLNEEESPVVLSTMLAESEFMRTLDKCTIINERCVSGINSYLKDLKMGLLDESYEYVSVSEAEEVGKTKLIERIKKILDSIMTAFNNFIGKIKKQYHKVYEFVMSKIRGKKIVKAFDLRRFLDKIERIIECAEKAFIVGERNGDLMEVKRTFFSELRVRDEQELEEEVDKDKDTEKRPTKPEFVKKIMDGIKNKIDKCEGLKKRIHSLKERLPKLPHFKAMTKITSWLSRKMAWCSRKLIAAMDKLKRVSASTAEA